MYGEKNSNEVRKLNDLINQKIRRLNSTFTQKLISCKNCSNMWKLNEGLTGYLNQESGRIEHSLTLVSVDGPGNI